MFFYRLIRDLLICYPQRGRKNSYKTVLIETLTSFRTMIREERVSIHEEQNDEKKVISTNKWGRGMSREKERGGKDDIWRKGCTSLSH